VTLDPPSYSFQMSLIKERLLAASDEVQENFQSSDLIKTHAI